MSSRQVRIVAVVVALAIVGGIALWTFGQFRYQASDIPNQNPPKEEPRPPVSGEMPVLANVSVLELKEDLSARYLRGYGTPNSTPRQDLVLVHDVLDAFVYTVKVPDALPTAGNREIVAALLGDNPYRIRFLNPAFSFLNEQRELVDRWKTPLYFHFVDASNPEIRSAGPDRTMWTADDLLLDE